MCTILSCSLCHFRSIIGIEPAGFRTILGSGDNVVYCMGSTWVLTHAVLANNAVGYVAWEGEDDDNDDEKEEKRDDYHDEDEKEEEAMLCNHNQAECGDHCLS